MHPHCIPLLLVCSAFLLPHIEARLSKSGKEKLQLKVRPKQENVETEQTVTFEGLPGEVEYEVDLSDQEGVVKEDEESEQSEVGRFFDWIHKLSMGEDIADRLDDMICAWDKVVGTELDTLVILLLGWLGFGGLIFTVSHIVYTTIGTSENVSLPTPATIPAFQKTSSPALKPSQLLPTTSDVSSLPNQSSAVGSDQEALEFVNRCMQFVLSEGDVGKDLVNRWMEKLNELTIRSAVDDGLLVEFIDTLQEGTAAPTVTNMTVETLPNDNLLVGGEMTASISFLLRTSRPVRDEMVTTDYVLHMDRIRSRFSITMITAEGLMIAKHDGWPDIKSRLSPVQPSNHSLSRDEVNLAEVVEDVAVQAIRGVQLEIRQDMMKNFPTFERKHSQRFELNQKKKSNAAFGLRGNTQIINGNLQQVSSRQLDVTIVKASQLGGSTGSCLEPYVVLEVDDPSQKNQSRTGSGSEYTWNDTFNIEINNQSSEVLFEVWDQGQKIGKSDAFMGLAIVSVSELMVTSSQRHVVPLQGRPYEDDQVTGLLTIEFLFKDGATLSSNQEPPVKTLDRHFESNETLSLAKNKLKHRKSTPDSLIPRIPDLLADAETFGKYVDEKDSNKHQMEGNLTTSENTQLMVPPRTRTDDQANSTQETLKIKEIKEPEVAGFSNIISSDSDLNTLTRGRKRTRTFFNSIKRKLSGTRSNSSTRNQGSTQEGPGNVRSVSEYRPENLSRTASFLSSPLQDDCSSMSGMSGISNASNASTKTFISEESSLVLETLENGQHHHYLIPIQVAKRGRFKKKGTKLHVYMDHIFVAQHIKLGSCCSACKRSIPLRLGKQAYVCRDCGITTHKPCHIKVETHCLQTTLPSLELEYYNEDSKK